MIALDPSGRPSFDTLLHTSRGIVFPECFYSFHNYVSTINDISPTYHAPSPPTATSLGIAPSSSTTTLRPGSSLSQAAGAPTTETTSEAHPSEADHRVEKLWADYESIEPYLLTEVANEPSSDVEHTSASTGVSRAFQVGSPVSCKHSASDLWCPGYTSRRALHPKSRTHSTQPA